MAIIDPDHSSTWPVLVRDAVRKTVKVVRRSTKYLGDLPISPEEDDAFRALLSPNLVRAYHATRLLPHEVSTIREQGLRALSPELLAERVAAAHRHGAIDAEQRAALVTANVFHEGHPTATNRQGTVCLFLSRTLLDDFVPGVEQLVSTWGGEGIYKSAAGCELRPMLRTLGVPTVIVVGIDLNAGRRPHLVCPGVLHCFVGRKLRLRKRFADVHYRGSIPAQQIVDVWQPGHPEFDRHAELLQRSLPPGHPELRLSRPVKYLSRWRLWR